MAFRLSWAALAGAIAAVWVAGASAQGLTSTAHASTRAVHAYQGHGAEQTERFSRRVKIGRDGHVSINNIAGDITVTAGGGDEVSIEAVKRSRGSAEQLARVQIVVQDRAGRVDIRTEYEGRNNNTAVDFALTLPASASIDATSISGSVKVTGIKGSVRATSVSGDVTTSDTPKVETARSTSGTVSIGGISMDGDLSAGSVSGDVRVKGVKARGLELGSVSGDVVVTDASCERLSAKSVSGAIEYTGSLARDGRYEMNTHSGSIRLTLPASPGFDLTATTFSGSIRSAFGMTVGGDSNDRRRAMSNRSIHAVYGDGSATLTLRTFSGNIVLEKR